MGLIEQSILSQAKRGQGETNERLDTLIAEQRKTNELLERLVLTLRPAPPS